MLETIEFLGFSEPFSSWSHLLSAPIFLALSFQLIRRGQGNAWRTASLVVYCFSVVFLLSMSGVYHLLEQGGVAKDVLRRLDHAGIWTLIFATFTPIHTILFKGFWRLGILSIVWTIGITGLVLEVIFMHSIPEWVTLSFYLGLGWVGFLSALQIHKKRKDISAKPMIIGGIAYSIGAVFDFTRWPVIFTGVFAGHELFHIFVIIGISCHWAFIKEIASLGISKNLSFTIKRRFKSPALAIASNENISFEFKDKKEFNLKLANTIKRVYGPFHSPKSVTLKYIDEHFISTDKKQELISDEIIYNKDLILVHEN